MKQVENLNEFHNVFNSNASDIYQKNCWIFIGWNIKFVSVLIYFKEKVKENVFPLLQCFSVLYIKPHLIIRFPLKLKKIKRFLVVMVFFRFFILDYHDIICKQICKTTWKLLYWCKSKLESLKFTLLAIFISFCI